MPRHVLPLVFFISVFLFAGCNRGDRLVPVKGKVFLDGAPMPGGPRSYVVYQPDRSKGNNSPHEPKAIIDADGSYMLSTAVNDGASLGWYRVRIEASESIDPKNPYVTKWISPEKYRDFQKSGLVVEVVDHPKDGAYDLKMQK